MQTTQAFSRVGLRVFATLAVTLMFVISSQAQPREMVLHNFSSSRGPGGLIQDGKGNLYGVTQGLKRNFGTIFKLHRYPKGKWCYKVLYRFTGGLDGAYPNARLVLDNAGNLYGATAAGGTNPCANSSFAPACGIVFELMPTPKGLWTEKVLFNFRGQGLGSSPSNGLIRDASGNFYGATASGAANPVHGVIYELILLPNGTWAEQLLYAFTGSTPVLSATGPLALDNVGNLYGVTNAGGNAQYCNNGSEGCGIAFRLSPSPTGPWTFTLLHTFCSQPDCSDGGFPFGGVIFDDQGNLYGTTSSGAVPSINGGTAFELSPGPGDEWTLNTLYSFCSAGGCPDGTRPSGGLVRDGAGNLYGSTVFGGVPDYGGTLFELSPTTNGSWTFQRLYSFCAVTDCADGGEPEGNLTLDSAGNIFGVAPVGGKTGLGVVFEITQ